ncbi:IS3 family transposase [Lactiplantibacillus plantarum]|nr:IS3 family transposase [Lactiplantibacillus plantarum]
MKVEVIDEQFETKAALIKAMTEWIDFYNHRRIKTNMDGKSSGKIPGTYLPESSLLKLPKFKGSLQNRVS